MKKEKENEPEISSVKVVFNQEGNTLGTTSEYESIEVSLEFQLSEKEGPFFVIKTEGWSFDDIQDIDKLVKKALKILK